MTHHSGDRIDLDLADVDRLEVHLIGGEVNVTANRHDDDLVHVEVEVLRGPAIEVDHGSDGSLVIDHKPVASLGGLLSGRVAIRAVVTVTVPDRTEVHVRTVSADSLVGGLTDVTSVTTVSGRVTATSLDGETALKSVSGDLDVQGVAGSLRCVTVSGDLTINGGSPTDVSARSVSGDLTFDLDEIAPLDCTTVSGDVAVRMPSDARFDVDAITVSGALECGFPDGDVHRGRRRMQGSVAGGGDRLTVRTTSGDVTLLRRIDAEADR